MKKDRTIPLNERNVLNLEEAALYLGLSANGLRNVCINDKENAPRFRRAGRRYLFPVEGLREWLNGSEGTLER